MISNNSKKMNVSEEVTTRAYGDIASRVLQPTETKPVQTTPIVLPSRQPSQTTPGWSLSLQTVLDQPPVSLPHFLIAGGIAFTVAFGAWATFGKIDEVGHAQGRLVPKGEVYKIHPTETGKIVHLSVKEGDSVKGGQLLAELDPNLASSEVERLEKMLDSYQLQLTQTLSILDRTHLELNTKKAIFAAQSQGQLATIAGVQANIDTENALLEQLHRDVKAQEERGQRLKPLIQQTDQLVTQLQTDVKEQETRAQNFATLPSKTEELLKQLHTEVEANQERVDRLQPLVEEGAISKEMLDSAQKDLRMSQQAIVRAQLGEEIQTKERQFEVSQSIRDRQNTILRTKLTDSTQTKERLFEVEQTLRDRQNAIIKSQGVLSEHQTQLNRLHAELNQKQAEATQTELEQQQKIQQLEVELTQLKAKIAENRTLLAQAQTKLKQRFIYAPVDGVISSLNVRNTGEVVQLGQTIAEIAPNHTPLILQATLPNNEAGFVKNGMTVQLKFEAFPYQEYGVVTGKVISISPDTKPDERLGAVYRVEVSLSRDFVTANHQKVKFKAGQTAIADIVIRQRRIVDLLLDPIRQLQKGGVSL